MALTPEIEQKIVEVLNKIEDIKVLEEALSILNPEQQAPAQLEQTEQPAEAAPEADNADTATAPEATKVADTPAAENQTVRPKDEQNAIEYKDYKGSDDANAARTSASGDRGGNTDRLSYNANEHPEAEVPQEESAPANDDVENNTIPEKDRYKNTQYQTYRGNNGNSAARTSASGGQGGDTIVQNYNRGEQKSGYRIQGDLRKPDEYKSYNLDSRGKSPDSSKSSAHIGAADSRADSKIDTKNSEEFEYGLEQALGQRNKEGIGQKVKKAVRSGIDTITGKKRRERKANEKIGKEMTDEMIRNSMYDNNQTYDFLKNYFAQIDEDYQGLISTNQKCNKKI